MTPWTFEKSDSGRLWAAKELFYCFIGSHEKTSFRGCLNLPRIVMKFSHQTQTADDSMLINSHLNNILLPQHSICHANLAQAVICGRSIDHVRNLFCAKFTAGRSIGTFTAASHSWDRSELLNLPQADCQSGKVIDWSERLLRCLCVQYWNLSVFSTQSHTSLCASMSKHC